MGFMMTNFVQWHEGMLLSPQHFQQSDNNIQHLFSLFSGSCSTFFYGIHDVKIDTSSLSAGVIRILKVRGIFQDGLSFCFDAMHDQPLEKNLSEYFLSNSSAIKIFLALPVRRERENNLTGDIVRYYSDEITNVYDENTGENSINIPILKPKLRLLLENEIDARYTYLPIFEAEKSVDGGITGTQFIPPYITLDEHSKISELCREIVQMIRNKVSYFSDRKDNYARSATEESMSSLRLLIQAMLPVEAIIKINGIQPFEIYKCLLNAISKIIAINPTQLIPRMPVYDHNNLFMTFDSILQYAKNILSALKQQYDIIPFEKDGAIFKLQMKKEWFEKDVISIGIQKRFASSDDEILSWISGVQIASESMLQMLKDRRVLGAERTMTERGAYITQPNGMHIISIKTKSTYIKPMEKLCVVNLSNGAIIPEEVILYVDC